MRSKFDLQTFKIEGLLLIKKNRLVDHRGYFERVYCQESFKEVSSFIDVQQINHSMTLRKGTVRGLHFQKAPHQETKVVTCIRGQIYDVAVDLRPGSKTYGQHVGVHLDAETQDSFLIPKGFAHGFQALTDHAEMIYLNDACYQADAEQGLSALDPELEIQWPLPPIDLSQKDLSLPNFASLCIGK